MASSVVRVQRRPDEGQDGDDVDEDEDEDEEEEYGSRGGLSSRVSLPSKPERKYAVMAHFWSSFDVWDCGVMKRCGFKNLF